jgi:predicted  nucleic acid-binding Zn-ribbon protein
MTTNRPRVGDPAPADIFDPLDAIDVLLGTLPTNAAGAVTLINEDLRTVGHLLRQARAERRRASRDLEEVVQQRNEAQVYAASLREAQVATEQRLSAVELTCSRLRKDVTEIDKYTREDYYIGRRVKTLETSATELYHRLIPVENAVAELQRQLVPIPTRPAPESYQARSTPATETEETP